MTCATNVFVDPLEESEESAAVDSVKESKEEIPEVDDTPGANIYEKILFLKYSFYES